MIADEKEPMRALVNLWLQKIRLAKKDKKEQFGDTARECMQFLDGPYNFIYDTVLKAGERPNDILRSGPETVLPRPTFRTSLNKAAELEQIFVALACHKNPVPNFRKRQLAKMTPEELGPIGMLLLSEMSFEDQVRDGIQTLRARFLDAVIRYSADELDLRGHARRACSEAVIKGRGLLWPQIYRRPGGRVAMIGAFYGSVDELLIDPDRDLEQALWVARERYATWWELERQYGLPYRSLKEYASHETYSAQSSTEMDVDGPTKRRQGKTSDLVTYYEIWSRLGPGARLGGRTATDAVFDALDEIGGDYVYLVVVPKCPYFLNLPPQMMDAPMDDQTVGTLAAQLQWPIPFHKDSAWPFANLDPHPHPTKAWPVSHLKPALGELQAMNWMASFMLDKAAITSRQIIGVAKDTIEEVKSQLLSGKPVSVVEINRSNEKLSDLITFLNHPGDNGDMMKTYELFNRQFERRTGMDENLYGQSARQIRSATEAEARKSAANIRPGDLADAVENWLKQTYRMMAFGARLFLQEADVAALLGPKHGQIWMQFVHSQDPEEVAMEFDVTVEAGSARKPNQDRDQENAQMAMQNVLPVLSQWAQMTGNVQPINQLLHDWARAHDLDADKYSILPPPLPPVQTGAPEHSAD